MVNQAEQRIEGLVKPAVESAGCWLWGLERVSGGKRAKLRIYIDKPDGVSIEDCERVSREISDLLDLEDAFDRSYILEVSSPGLDRILFSAEQFRSHVGAEVDLRLNFPVQGRKRFVGRLAAVEGAEVRLCTDGGDCLLPLENVQRARLVPRFD